MENKKATASINSNSNLFLLYETGLISVHGNDEHGICIAVEVRRASFYARGGRELQDVLESYEATVETP